MPQLRSRRCRARLLARRRPRDPVRQPRRRGSVVKAAGVDDSILTFSRPAVVAESQEEAVDAILHDGDTASIDIPNRRLTLEVAEAELAEPARDRR